ncbi:tail completion or Neck1 protein [Streptomyces phage Celia]|uniref:Uncharacterized protein n=1 Tax=Streptomyces phage Celia TaxID=2590946 RepID=A0A516KR97_9CAUD|nr:tail completion or Neck1 protein [Streptomyces phage Celia]QDP44216.1 hypothetical protein SEA_CELIA_13 [Streptomyces phage Celia]QFG10476.1 hypothetical protein SEA_URZA_13 [Streptomyces phage Urza]QJD50578.1 hypothetical protein SEA_ITZA_13 [Streptomyces phage Itza]
MAKIYRSVGGRKFEQYIAMLPEVQAELDRRTFEIGIRAEELLAQHRLTGDASIEIESGKIDRYVILSDDRGQKAALSIEYGRQAYTVTRKDKFGNEFEVEVGAMDGLYILATASHLPKKRKGRVRI